MTTLDRDIANFAERLQHFDRAIEAAKASDQRAFSEAINAFWNTRDGSDSLTSGSRAMK